MTIESALDTALTALLLAEVQEPGPTRVRKTIIIKQVVRDPRTARIDHVVETISHEREPIVPTDALREYKASLRRRDPLADDVQKSDYGLPPIVKMVQPTKRGPTPEVTLDDLLDVWAHPNEIAAFKRAHP